MPFNSNITPGRPPVLWSDVNDAFIKVNENFDILVATIGGGSGLIPINFASLDTSVKPTTDNLYGLGDITHRWKSVYTGEYTVADPLNGLWAGNAQIKGVGFTVNLPASSTIGGDPVTGVGASLIIDPTKTFFKEIQVNNDLSVVAMEFGDTVNLLQGSGISLAVSSGADSITISNTGILSVAAGSGITAATVSGVSTITNAGVRSLQSTTSLPSGRTTGAGINISGSTGDNLRITNAGVISVSSGVGITVSTDAATGDVTITNSAPAGNTFSQVEVNGDSSNRLAADAASDVLNINSGEGITLTKNVGTDTLTIAINPVFDLKGSVFGDDSSVIVNAIDRVVTAAGGFVGNVTGNLTGTHTGDIFTTLIDSADSSAITVTPNTIFSADVSVENDLSVIAAVSIGGILSVGRISSTALSLGATTGTTTVNNTTLIGPATSANSTRFPGARVVVSSVATNIQQNETSTNIGIMAEGVGVNAGNYGVGLYGAGYTAGNARGTGVTGEGHVSSAGDTASAIGIRGYANDVHPGGFNVGLFGDATNGSSNYALYMNTGDIYSNTAQTWTLTGNLTFSGAYTVSATAATATTASTASSLGYLGLPQSATATTATLAIGDVGKHIYVNTSGQTITIPAASSVAYPIGTTITFIAGASATTVTIAIATDTMYLVGAGTTGSRTLAAHGMATAVKVSGLSSSGVWYINGSGLT